MQKCKLQIRPLTIILMKLMMHIRRYIKEFGLRAATCPKGGPVSNIARYVSGSNLNGSWYA